MGVATVVDSTATPSTPTTPPAAEPSTTAAPSTLPSTTLPVITPPPNPFADVPSDERTLQEVARITGDLAAKSVVASPDGLVFAQNMMYRHTVTVFDRSYTEVATIPDNVDLAAFGIDAPSGNYQGAPVEAAVTPDGRHVYVSNYRMYGPGFVRDAGDGCNRDEGDPSFVYRIDTETLAIDQVIPVGKVPKFLAVTPDGSKVLVTNWCSFDFMVIDRASSTVVATIDIGRHPRGIAVSSDSSTAYVSVMGGSDIARIDLDRAGPDDPAGQGEGVVTWLRGVGPAPRHLVLAPDDRTLYVSLNGEGTIVGVDAESGEVTARVSTGRAPRSMALSPDARSLYVVNYDSDTMAKVRTADFQVVQTIDTADKPIGITTDAETGEVWVSTYSGVIHVLAEQVAGG